MIGLAYLIAAGVYLLVTVVIVRWAWRQGRQATTARARVFAGLAGFALLLPLVYDYVPMLIAHKHYCDKDGGITVSQDPGLWLEGHAGEVDRLSVRAGGESVDPPPPGWDSR